MKQNCLVVTLNILQFHENVFGSNQVLTLLRRLLKLSGCLSLSGIDTLVKEGTFFLCWNMAVMEFEMYMGFPFFVMERSLSVDMLCFQLFGV